MDKRLQQLSLLDDFIDLSALFPLVKADMRRILGPDGDENRKSFVGKLNKTAARCGVKLTSGNSKELSLDMLNKMLSPSDTSHPLTLLFILVFCIAAKDFAPLRRVVRAVGLDIMTEEDRKFRDFGRAIRKERLAKKEAKDIEAKL